MKKLILLLLLPFLPLGIAAQWTMRQSLNPNTQRTFATAFSANGKAYVIGGQVNFNGLADVWEYDPVQDAWTQKNNFPGGLRGGASAFSIGSKAYLVGGSNYTGQYFNDVWEYDPLLDSWTQKNNFPGNPREEAVGFAINGLGYFGTGYQEVVGPNSTFFVTFSDFYEYNPVNDSWTPKALFPGAQRGWAIGAAVGGRGYVGLGGNSAQNLSYNDFYEYNPQTNAWTAKAGFGNAVADAMAFHLGAKIFVCGGFNFGNPAMYSTMRSFDPANNSWSVEAPMSSPAAGAVAVTIGNRAFVGTGYNAAFNERNDWWEFTSPTATLCQAPVSFSVTGQSTTSQQSCDGKIVVSNITNGCSPYACSVVPAGGLISSGPGFTISGLCAGAYSVYVTDANCCGTAISVCTVTASPAVAINANAVPDPILVVKPNPSQGKFSLSAGNGSVLSASAVRLTNSLGQEIPFHLSVSDTWSGLSLLHAVPGLYTLQVLINGQWRQARVLVD
jgi:N-acetylneuraminic acid mutarotase